MLENKFYKVSTTGGGYNVATLYNPITHEQKTACILDNDYDEHDRRYPNGYELFAETVYREAEEAWQAHNGIIVEGCTVEVVKGRKIPKGYTGIVQKISPWRDYYGRVKAIYIYFVDGKRTSIDNCVRV